MPSRSASAQIVPLAFETTTDFSPRIPIARSDGSTSAGMYSHRFDAWW